MNQFIFVTSDSELISGAKVPAMEIIRQRLKLKIWPIYRRTRNKASMIEGDKIIFYVGGANEMSGHLVATGTIYRVRNSGRGEIVDSEDYLTSTPDKIVELKDIRYLKSPIRFVSKIEHLEMKPKNMKKWGVILMGGVKKISKRDYDLLMSDLSVEDISAG